MTITNYIKAGVNFSPLLRGEIARVQTELVVFRDEILPVLLDEPPLPMTQDSVPPEIIEQRMRVCHPLSEWQNAVTAVADSLPITNNVVRLQHEDFAQFMFQQATPGYSITDDCIRWKIQLFNPVEWRGEFPPCVERENRYSSPHEQFIDQMPTVKNWLMSLSVKDNLLFNGLCSIVPLIADHDPAFAKLALDPQTWELIVGSNHALTECERRRDIDWIRHRYFGVVINNALLHTFSALGNNHFLSIRDYLDHPCLHGSYTELMPHYLFALLFEKVRLLQDVAVKTKCLQFN